MAKKGTKQYTAVKGENIFKNRRKFFILPALYTSTFSSHHTLVIGWLLWKVTFDIGEFEHDDLRPRNADGTFKATKTK